MKTNDRRSKLLDDRRELGVERFTRVRRTGAKILSSATTVEEARWLESHGVDAVIAQGLEAGGHRGMFLTAYLLCPEATTSEVHRAALRSGAARHTAVTNVITGRPARAIVNRIVRELGPMRLDVPQFPRPAGAVMPLRAAAESRGSDDFSPLWAGQNASRCRAIPAAELTRELAGKM